MTHPSRSRASRYGQEASPEQVRLQKRRVVKAPVAPPLPQERRYVNPTAARAAVTYNLFTWATKHNRGESRRFRIIPRSVSAPRAAFPNEAQRRQERFNDYFELGGFSRSSLRSGAGDLNVHRNRILFLALVAALVLYTLSRLAA